MAYQYRRADADTKPLHAASIKSCGGERCS